MKFFRWMLGVITFAAAAATCAAPITEAGFTWDPDKVEIKTLKVTDSIYVLEGMGGNIGVSVGDDGVLLIDSQLAPITPKILAAVKAISDKPVRFLVNTHWHLDHTGGNENLGKAGVTIVAHDNVYKRMAVESVMSLMHVKMPPASKAALPVITFTESISFSLNGDTIVATHVVPSHTDGDSFVRFQKANVIHTGDVFAAGRYPYLDVDNGGSAEGVLVAIDKLIAQIDDNTVVIPSHGPISRKADVIAFRKMFSTVTARVKAMIKAGKTKEQVVAAKPLREFDAEWGRTRKTDVFVANIYVGLKSFKRPKTNRRPLP